MPRSNLIFAIVTPLVLMAVIAAIVIPVGEALLAMHHWAHHAYHVGDYPTAAENRYWREIAALYPVSIALGISALALIGGVIASAMAPQPKQPSDGSGH